MDLHLFKSLFLIAGIGEPQSEEDFNKLHQEISSIINFLDEPLSRVSNKHTYECEEQSTKIRENVEPQSMPQIVSLSKNVISGMVCIPGIQNIED